MISKYIKPELQASKYKLRYETAVHQKSLSLSLPTFSTEKVTPKFKPPIVKFNNQTSVLSDFKSRNYLELEKEIEKPDEVLIPNFMG